MSGIKVQNSTGNIKTSLALPASKSISNRLLLIRALCKENIETENLSTADDTIVLQKCIENLYQGEVFDVIDAGTAFRFLTALFAITPGSRHLTGSKRMLKRPIKDLVKALNELGANITYAGKKNYPPLIIQGTEFAEKKVTIPAGTSSQFISALLLIAPMFPDGLQLKLSGEIASEPYIKMTLKVMEQFGIKYQWNSNKIYIGKQSYIPFKFEVEADWSAAAFWYQIVSLSKDAELELTGLTQDSLQGDSVVAEIFDKLGVKTSYLSNSILLTKKESSVVVFSYDFLSTPDLFPAVMSSCVGLHIPFRFSGLKNLAIKESDRVLVMITELAKFGYYFNYEKAEGLLVYDGNSGNYPDTEVICNSYNDHRIAMSLAPMTLLHFRIDLNGYECVSKSYPGYFDDLKRAGFSIEY